MAFDESDEKTPSTPQMFSAKTRVNVMDPESAALKIVAGYSGVVAKIEHQSLKDAVGAHASLSSMLLGHMRLQSNVENNQLIELGALREYKRRSKRKIAKLELKVAELESEQDSTEQMLLGAIIGIGNVVGDSAGKDAKGPRELASILQKQPGVTKEKALQYVALLRGEIEKWPA